jgi:hypothetical protein
MTRTLNGPTWIQPKQMPHVDNPIPSPYIVKMTTLTDRDLSRLLRRIVTAEGLNAWARAHGIDAASVSRVANGVRRPSEAVGRALGFERGWRRVK